MSALKTKNPLPLSGHINAYRFAVFFPLLLALAAQFPCPLRASEATAPSGKEPMDVSLMDLPSRVVLGEPFHLQVRATFKNPASQIDLELPDVSEGPLRFLSEVSKKQSQSEGKSVCLFGLDAVMLEMGKQTVPSFSVAYKDEKGKLRKMHTRPSTLSVISYLETLPAQGKVAPKLPNPPIVWHISRWLWVFLALAGAVLLTLVAYLLWRLRRPNNLSHALEHAPPELPPDEEALQALSEIELSGMVLRQEAKTYYSRLSEIMRRYLARHFHLDALEMTSLELLDTMQRLKLPPQTCEALRQDLAESDSVKFARFVPSSSNREEALQRVRQVVMETRVIGQEPLDSETSVMPIRPMSGAGS